MLARRLCRLLLFAIVIAALVQRAHATSLETDGKLLVTGIVVVSAAVAAGVTLLIIHHNHTNSKVTGCVSSGKNGMTIADEKDRRTYSLSAASMNIKAGDRMTLGGKRHSQSDGTFAFEAQRLVKDFGACVP